MSFCHRESYFSYCFCPSTKTALRNKTEGGSVFIRRREVCESSFGFSSRTARLEHNLATS